jgi:hypothetical protein
MAYAYNINNNLNKGLKMDLWETIENINNELLRVRYDIIEDDEEGKKYDAVLKKLNKINNELKKIK